MSLFKKATKERAWLRLAFTGPAGNGKTFSALRVAEAFDGPIGLIDTEHGSAKKYADKFDFLHAEMPPPYDPRNYIEWIKMAAKEGVRVLIIDSLSHAYNGRGGLLEIVDQAAERQFRGNSFAGWKVGTPVQNSLIDAILGYPGHVIVTMRSKTDYVVEEDPRTGKSAPRKVGMAPIQRDGTDYEFDIIVDMDRNNVGYVSKSRYDAITRTYVEKPDAEFGRVLRAWLEDGGEETRALPCPADLVAKIKAAMDGLGMNEPQRIAALSRRGAASVELLTEPDAREMLSRLQAKLAEQQPPSGGPESLDFIERGQLETDLNDLAASIGTTVAEVLNSAGVDRVSDLTDDALTSLVASLRDNPLASKTI